MIIEKQNTNLFSFPSDHILVNTVNCVGVMGKGIALQFKNRFPDHFKDYQKACQNKEIQIGKCWLWKDLYISIIAFPTKEHWRNPSKYEYIEKGLDSLKNLVLFNNMENIVIPKLGCGCGGLDYDKVRNIIYDKLENTNHNFILI